MPSRNIIPICRVASVSAISVNITLPPTLSLMTGSLGCGVPFGLTFAGAFVACGGAEVALGRHPKTPETKATANDITAKRFMRSQE